jgi:hypothetical protein
MGKKKKKKESKPWCWYCDREFDDEKILIQHQKAKHFRCHLCHKKMNTAGGMVTHMTQVHKEELKKIPNALPGRDSTDIEIFGMEGVPEDDLLAHEGLTPEEIKRAKLEREQENAPAWPGGILPTVPPYIPGYAPFVPPVPGYPMAMPGIPRPLGWGPAPVPLPRPGFPVPVSVPLPAPGTPPRPAFPLPTPPAFGTPTYGTPTASQFPSAYPPGSPSVPRPATAPGTYPPTNYPSESNSNNNSRSVSPPPSDALAGSRASPPPPGLAPPMGMTYSAGQESGDFKLIYNDNEISMEEKRAMLARYQLNYQQDAFKTKVQQLDQSIQSRLSSLEGIFQRN